MTIAVTLYRDYAEDRRISMDVYADSLARSLREYGAGQYDLREYVPHILRGLNRSTWSMRLARYGVYPFQAEQHQGTLNHILDHGYGHLLYRLDPARTVVTVHDLFPLVRWRGGIPGISRGRRPWLNLFSFRALRRAAHLIADSENTRCDLIRYCGCSPDKISVISLGLDSIFRPYSLAEKQRAAGSLGLDMNGPKRIMVMGTQQYKNLGGALRAIAWLRKLSAQPIQIVKVGNMTDEWSSQAEQLGLKDIIVNVEVTRSQLPDVYNLVDCLLVPSFYEGFGWPPLESMACGVPVVTSNAGSLPEVVGDAGIMRDPLDDAALAQAMYNLFTDDALHNMYIQRGLIQSRRFTWRETALKTLDVYEGIAQE